MSKKTSLLFTLFIFTFLISSMIWYWGKENETFVTDLEKKTTETIEENEIIQETSRAIPDWQEIQSWNRVNDTPLSYTYTEDPIVLFVDDDKGALYVQSNELRYIFPTNEGLDVINLLAFEQTLDDMKFWINDSHILMGGEKMDHEGNKTPIWYSVDCSNLEGALPEVTKIIENNYSAGEVLTMTYVSEPNLFYMTIDDEMFGFDELIYQSGQHQFENLQLEFMNDNNGNSYIEAREQYELRKPNRQSKPDQFDQFQTFVFTENNTTIYTFEDVRGTIIYFKQDSNLQFRRYVDYKIDEFKMMFDGNGKGYPIGLVTDAQGKNFFVLPTKNDNRLSQNSLLWKQDEWNIFFSYRDNVSFYKIKEDELHFIRYKYDWDEDIYQFKSNIYSLKDVTFIEQSNTLFKFETADGYQYLSLYDLSKYVSPVEQIEQTLHKNHSLWVHDTDLKLMDELEKKDTEPEKILAELPSQFFPIDEELFPETLLQAEDKICLFGCGDISFEATRKEISNQWYVISRTSLYTLQNGELIEIADLPIKTSNHMAFESYLYVKTAQDFTKFDENWFIADTYSHRILKLNEQFEIIGEYGVHLPEKINMNEEGHLQIESIAGVTFLDTNLNLINAQLKEFHPPISNIVEEKSFDKDHLYQNSESNIKWFLYYNTLIQYNTDTGLYRNFFVGSNYAANSKPRLINMNQQISILFDDRMLIFNTEGNWLKTISFPRSSKEGDGTSFGESTFYIDEQNGVIYLIQGYKLLKINIITNEVSTLFHQNDNYLGNLLYHQNVMYFSVHSGPNENELIIFDLNKGDFRRIKIETDYYTKQLQAGNDQETKIIFSDQFGESWKSVLLSALH
ncbi:hypothetical protein [Chengkuizengella axinellae]|uniref:DUF5050 domain-containing protein n=1 Tax=Chengkuizengella axinellae TaxID=3064388 RepID=A0ABT9IWP6_9BACL|nr:hypothetical protein [Chengkuizengella sp. 2205SS18-9]MDP5273755.1 hypothetical protein [Chengkuizengella sp. 2205SS18-9]